MAIRRSPSTNADGTTTTYSLSGPGVGTLTPSEADAFPDGSDAAELTGTAADSVLTVTSSAPLTPIGPLSVDGPIGAIDAADVTATDISAEADVAQITLGALAWADGGAGLTLSGTAPVSLSLGAVTNAVVSVAGPITSLALTSWSGPSSGETPIPDNPGGFSTVSDLSADSIGAFTDSGSFSGQITTAGSIGTLTVGDDLAGDVLAGVTSAIDIPVGRVGAGATTVDDVPVLTFAVATIGDLRVGGSIAAGTIVAAGLDVPTEAFPPTTANATLLAGGSIASVSVVGSIGSGVAIVAASLPDGGDRRRHHGVHGKRDGIRASDVNGGRPDAVWASGTLLSAGRSTAGPVRFHLPVAAGAGGDQSGARGYAGPAGSSLMARGGGMVEVHPRQQFRPVGVKAPLQVVRRLEPVHGVQRARAGRDEHHGQVAVPLLEAAGHLLPRLGRQVLPLLVGQLDDGEQTAGTGHDGCAVLRHRHLEFRGRGRFATTG